MNNLSIFQQKYIYLESVLNSSCGYDQIQTNEQILAGKMNNVDFLISSNN